MRYLTPIAALALAGCTNVLGTVNEDATEITAPALTEAVLAGEFDASVEIIRSACAEGQDWRAVLYVVRPTVGLGDTVVVAPTPEEFSTLCEAAAVRAEEMAE